MDQRTDKKWKMVKKFYFSIIGILLAPLWLNAQSDSLKQGLFIEQVVKQGGGSLKFQKHFTLSKSHASSTLLKEQDKKKETQYGFKNKLYDFLEGKTFSYDPDLDKWYHQNEIRANRANISGQEQLAKEKILQKEIEYLGCDCIEVEKKWESQQLFSNQLIRHKAIQLLCDLPNLNEYLAEEHYSILPFKEGDLLRSTHLYRLQSKYFIDDRLVHEEVITDIRPLELGDEFFEQFQFQETYSMEQYQKDIIEKFYKD